MAKLIGNLLSGALGPYVFKIVNGKQVVTERLPRGTMKQSAATKKKNATFGDACSLAGQFRKSLSVQLNGKFDLNKVNLLNTPLIKTLNACRDPEKGVYKFEIDSFSRLEGYEFSPKSAVNDLMWTLPDVNYNKDLLMVSIPTLQLPEMLSFPDQCMFCKITITLSLFRLKEGLMVELAETRDLEFTNEHKTVGSYDFSFDVPAGTLCVVGVFLNYYTASTSGWKPYMHKGFNPGCICRAIYTPGKFQNSDTRKWVEMRKIK